MKFTIITVALNNAKTIKDTFETVLAQTYSNLEHIVVDGASTDGTVEIIKHYEPRFEGRMRWISEKDSCLYEAMNKGIAMATGDVIGFLNADDFFCNENVLAEINKTFENQQVDAVYADLYYVAQNNKNKIVRNWVSGVQRSFSDGWHPAHPTLYIKKTIYDQYGSFNLDFKFAADTEIMIRFLERYKIKAAYLPLHIVKMRLGGISNRNLRNIIQQNIWCIRAFKVNNVKINKLTYFFKHFLQKLRQFTIIKLF